MSEALKTNNESISSPGPETEHPTFQDRRAGICVSEEEARQIGEIPPRDFETIKKQAEEWLRNRQAEGSIIPLGEVTIDQIIEANREFFFDVQKRRAFIAKTYPELLDDQGVSQSKRPESVPESIFEEFSQGELLCLHMLLSINKDSVEDGVQYPNGTIFPKFYGDNPGAASHFLRYQESRKQNDQILDQEALASFETPPTQNIEEVREKLEQVIDMIHATTDVDRLMDEFDLSKLREKGLMPKESIISDIEIEYELQKLKVDTAIDNERHKRTQEVSEELERRISEISAEIRSLEEQINKLKGRLFSSRRDLKRLKLAVQTAGKARNESISKLGKIGRTIFPLAS